MIPTRRKRFWLTLALVGCVTIALVIAAVGIIPKLTTTQCPADSSHCAGCEVPTTIPVDNYPSVNGYSRWSPNCEYFAAIDRHGSSLNPYRHWTVYETTTWTPVCEVGWGDIMLSMGPVGGYCELPLSNGQTWVVLGGGQREPEVRFVVCDDPKTCVDPANIRPLSH